MDKFALHNIECYETDNRLKTYKTIYTEIQFFQEIEDEGWSQKLYL